MPSIYIILTNYHLYIPFKQTYNGNLVRKPGFEWWNLLSTIFQL